VIIHPENQVEPTIVREIGQDQLVSY